MPRHSVYIVNLLVFAAIVLVSWGQQVELKFEVSQAQQLWVKKSILGNSTHFLHPISMGTVSECDMAEIARVFTADYTTNINFTVDEQHRGLEGDRDWVRATYEASYRNIHANRTIDKNVVSVEGCLMACITEKAFFCHNVDYFERDGGKCALYAKASLVFVEASDTTQNTAHPYYVGDNPSSDHYRLYKSGESKETCSQDAEAYPYFALGWKAMEAGWYNLARMMFNNATTIDENYHMAYVGRMLSHTDMGYGLIDIDGVSFKDRLKLILDSVDFEAKLSYQEQFLVRALHTLQSGADYQKGLNEMSLVFADNTGNTLKDVIIKVIEGNGLLLARGVLDRLKQLAKDEKSVYALQLLTHNLNPYGAGENRTSLAEQEAVVEALFIFADLNVNGAWPITFAGSDIAEYYSKWTRGFNLLSKLKEFRFANTRTNDADRLLIEDDTDYIVNGLNVKYVGKSKLRVYIHERLNFFSIQRAHFQLVDAELGVFKSENQDPTADGYMQLKMIRYRIIANSYFSTYDYIYERFVTEALAFDEEDWTEPIEADGSDDLEFISRAYYWAAAAVNKLRNGQDISAIEDAFRLARPLITADSYKDLFEIYWNVVKGTTNRMAGNYIEALSAADTAASHHDKLKGADFTINGNDESVDFRMLVPLGYQFKADMYSQINKDTTAKEALGESAPTLADVITAYEIAVNTAPLNTSRLLKGYGDALSMRDRELPRRETDLTPGYVYAYTALEDAWRSSQTYDGGFPALDHAKAEQDYYFNKVVAGCKADRFEIISDGDNQLCWGGYIVIGVSVAIIIIIIIIVGILCLRKKAEQTTSTKKKEKGFMFSGPAGISRQESFASYHMGTLSRDSEATPYASQTLSIQRPFMDDYDYSKRSNTLGANGKAQADEEFEVSTAH